MMRRVLAIFLFALAVGTFGVRLDAQQPPGTGGYTFQGQGNLAQVLSGLANPTYGVVPFGTKLSGYSLIQPFGDITESPNILGQFNVTGAHWSQQTCSTSPCAMVGTIISCNASAGPITLQLPGASGSGYFASVQKVDQTNNACNVTAAGSDTINGLNAIPITTPFLPMELDDSNAGMWFAGLLTLATGATGINGFPLVGTADFNNYSGINVGGLQYVQQPAPSNLSATATCTGTCATTYTYEVTCLTAFGESPFLNNGSANTTTATNASSLTTANNNVLSWTFQPQCRSGYNVYGRTGGMGFLITLPQNTITWTDDGSIANPVNSYTFTWASSAYPAVQVWDLQGAVTNNPVDIFAANSNANSRSLSLPAVTTSQNHDLQVGVFAIDKSLGALTGPSGFTSTVTVAASSASNYGLVMAERDRASSGTTGISTATTAQTGAWATLNLTIESSNVSNAITLGNTPTFTANSPYTSVTFGDPSGTATGDLELVCVSFLNGTSIQAPTAPANFVLIASVISATNKVQVNCYYNVPTISGGTPPPTTNTTGVPTITSPNGTVTNLGVQETFLASSGAYGNNTNFPTGNLVAQGTATKPGHFSWLTSTTQSLNAGSCSTAPTFNIFDGSSKTGTAKIASATVQNTKGTATTQSQSLTFLAGDIIGIYVSTQGATCLAPTFNVTATVDYP